MVGVGSMLENLVPPYVCPEPTVPCWPFCSVSIQLYSAPNTAVQASLSLTLCSYYTNKISEKNCKSCSPADNLPPTLSTELSQTQRGDQPPAPQSPYSEGATSVQTHALPYLYAGVTEYVLWITSARGLSNRLTCTIEGNCVVVLQQ